MSEIPELIPGFDVNGNPTMVQNPMHPSYSEGDSPVVVARRADGSFGYVRVEPSDHPRDARVDLRRHLRDLGRAAQGVKWSLVDRAMEIIEKGKRWR